MTLLPMTASTGESGERELTATVQPTREGGIPADTFAVRLLLARHHAGHLSIREASARCGIGHATWTKWERGARPVDILDVCRRIADALEIDHDWLLFGGPLAGPRGLPTKRRGGSNLPYARVAVRPRDSRPSGGPASGRQAPPTYGVSPRRPVRISGPGPVPAGRR